ncbi:Protein of unknown function [Epilithonimonas bovis DSM 19482]|uniref:DUF2911 domain-containing protein n=1 Tax=Epilithonimonas bovis DSM 19482 TaxID=1121284 RepID=A0A1U7PX48_9FLAO|nr:DUF2911 domain-containing protein [Epilithonimonas bovis]SIT98126.1 Protein of unknown function [Epilithonimonas bovis DSM 19482]
MKNLIIAASLLLGVSAFSQAKLDPTKLNYFSVDVSPMDAVYYPLQVTSSKTETPKIKVLYSRPQKKNRVVFGNLVKYGEIWRFGANENTEIKFYTPVILGGKEIPAGTYSLFAIPNEKEWTVIINSDTDKWGAYAYDKSKDVVRITVPVEKTAAPIEYFSVTFVQTKAGADLYAGWDDAQIKVPIEFK